MKKFIKTTVLSFTLLGANLAHSQTTVYADTVLTVSSEYGISDATCSNSWSACRILGAPDVYPACGDLVGSWTFPCGTSRQWIEISYSTQLYVDTVRIYETNHSGAIDTVYLRDVSTGNWNTIYAAPNNPNFSCNIFDIIIPTTSYKVDAVRIAIADYSLGWCYPEFDAVALIGSVTTGINEQEVSKIAVFPTPTNGQITVKTEGKGTTIFTVFDVFGNVVFSQKLSQETENISLNIPSGIYVSVIENDGKPIINKLIIQ